jgi:hypothetical protein
MHLFNLEFYLKNIRILGVIAIIVGLGAWIMDLMGYVYICPFCRAQRTVIAILGLVMILHPLRHFILLYITSILGFYGTFVASSQHFRGWVSIQQGKFNWHDPWYLEPFMLSFFAICIIIAQVWLIFLSQSENNLHKRKNE